MTRHVLVLGAGVVGVTTAYLLNCAGHRVTVLDAANGPASGASFGNAGHLAPGFARPWATPALPFQLWRWMRGRDAAVRLACSADPAFLRWMAEALAACRPARYRTYLRNLQALALDSVAALDGILAETGITLEGGTGGALNLLSEQSAVETARRTAGAGVEILDREACVAREPGLAAADLPIAGGEFHGGDRTGDCRRFTVELAEEAKARGVDMAFGREAQSIRLCDGRAVGVDTTADPVEADAIVVALGVASSRILRGFGIRIPVLPVKGYSMTVDVCRPDLAPRATVLVDRHRISVNRLGDRIRVAGIADFADRSAALPAEQTAKLVRGLEAVFPGAAQGDEPAFWCGFRPATPSGLPFIGATKIPGLFVNTGHGSIGWTLAAGSARRLCTAFEASLADGSRSQNRP